MNFEPPDPSQFWAISAPLRRDLVRAVRTGLLPEDFKALHDAAGEVSDYAAMKAEVLANLAEGAISWLDLDLSWLEWPDVDLSSIFDWVDFPP